jgi:hypothetical protein
MISSNWDLTSLDGPSNLTLIGSSFYVGWNLSLPDCEACELLDQITTGPTSINVQYNLDDACTPVPDNCP